MNIIETNIPDINATNIDQTKVHLANTIIQNVTPLFNDLQQEKKVDFNNKLKEYNRIKETVVSNKKTIELLFDNYKRKQKIKKLLERIDKLVSFGLVKEGTVKQETIVLLKVIDKLSNEKLDFHLKDTLNTLNKRFPG
jgi:hypothetical protein